MLYLHITQYKQKCNTLFIIVTPFWAISIYPVPLSHFSLCLSTLLAYFYHALCVLSAFTIHIEVINKLPERLHILRTKYGYSQKQVAKKLGISPSIISGYETGERTPSTEILLALSYLYNCSTDYLLGKQQSGLTVSVELDDLTEKQISAILALVDSIKNPS